MKKFLIAIFASLALLFTGVAAAPIASASPSIEKSVSASGSFQTLKTTGVTIAGGVNKPMWLVVPGSCYWTMDGRHLCYRYSCTNWEYWFYGCRDGYYQVSSLWWA